MVSPGVEPEHRRSVRLTDRGKKGLIQGHIGRIGRSLWRKIAPTLSHSAILALAKGANRMARLPYVNRDPGVDGDNLRQLYAEIATLRGSVHHLHQVLANQPAALRAFMV